MGYRKLPPLQLPDEIGIAYLAGIIDADGHIACNRVFSKVNSKNVSHAVKVVVTNTSEDLMTYLEMLGGSMRLKRHKKHDKDESRNPDRWKPTYDWSVTGNNAEMLLRAILPYLIIKHARAKIALQIRNVKSYWEGRGLAPEVVAEKERLTNELNTMNARGIVVN